MFHSSTVYNSMVATDLDGTLLNGDRQCHPRDQQTLMNLGGMACCRVIATGRSLHSLRRVVPEDFPVDFIVFSSGSGILDCSSGKLSSAGSLSTLQIARVATVMKTHCLDYAILHQVPDSHRFTCCATGRPHADYQRRRTNYADFEDTVTPAAACQFLAITDPSDGLFTEIAKSLPEFSVIRATSPLDHHSMWIEIYPKGVSKASACERIRDLCSISQRSTLAIGNDYNDIDLLIWADRGIVVGNAPEPIRSRFASVADNNSCGFTEAVLRSDMTDYADDINAQCP